MAPWTAGERLFAQYACAPNSLGYCGPDAADGLLRGARGEDPALEVRTVAKGFSGAWPYQQIVSDLAGIPDLLDERVVRGYWTGNEVTRSISPEVFGAALLDRLRPQAGHYWTHLTESLLVEAAPTHAFHVLAVYPWTRLLDSGPEALGVLESCRIGWGEVESVGEGPPGNRAVTVRRSALGYDGELALGEPESCAALDDGFTAPLERGDMVALHWGRICDRLTSEEVDELEYWTRWQLTASNPRIRAAAAGA